MRHATGRPKHALQPDHRRIPFLRRNLLALLLTTSTTLPLPAIEKHWFAHQAQVIVVGTYSPNPTYPWLDGWRMTGEIKVIEVLYGPQMPSRIKFKQVCPWESCESWPPPFYPQTASTPALWFLTRIDENTWTSPLGISDFGYRSLSERAYWQQYIQRSKIHPWPGFNSKTSNF